MERKNLTKTAYNAQQSKEYDEKRFTTPAGKLFQKLELEQLQNVLQLIHSPGRVLEVGCGTGRFLETVIDGGHQAYGVDPSPDMLKISESKYSGRANVKFEIGEGANLPYEDEQFDFVYSIRTLNQTESREYAFRTIAELIRVTKPGGILLIEFCNSLRPYSPAKKRATVLSIFDIRRTMREYEDVRIVKLRGILILSETLLNRVPRMLLPAWGLLDRILSRILPMFAARCYVILKRASTNNIAE